MYMIYIAPEKLMVGKPMPLRCPSFQVRNVRFKGDVPYVLKTDGYSPRGTVDGRNPANQLIW